MPTYEQPSEPLVFPHRQHMRLFISVSAVSEAGKQVQSQNTMPIADVSSLDGALRAAQQEIVEQEIFSLLVKEAGSLPTASARVSERLIVIEAAQAVELKFELVCLSSSILAVTDETQLDADAVPAQPPEATNAKCDLIYYALQALLLRMHAYAKRQRLGTAGIFRAQGATDAPPPPLLLRPVIDLLQYEVFCARLHTELAAMRTALAAVGIPAALRFEPIGGTGHALVDLVDKSDDKERAIGGEAVLRIDNRCVWPLSIMHVYIMAHCAIDTPCD